MNSVQNQVLGIILDASINSKFNLENESAIKHARIDRIRKTIIFCGVVEPSLCFVRLVNARERLGSQFATFKISERFSL